MTAVKWLEEFMNNGKQKSEGIISLAFARAKELESKQQKDMFIAGYLARAMKKNKLPYGVRWMNKVAEIEEEAEIMYDKYK